jgi:hypothetical protein
VLTIKNILPFDQATVYKIEGNEMYTEQKYTKANLSIETNTILKILAAEQRKFVYQVIDEIVKERYPNRFQNY